MGNFPQFSFEPPAQGTPASDPPNPRPKRRGRPPSIGIRLGQDGKADVNSMTPEQASKIRKALEGTALLTPDEKKAIEESREEKKQAFKPLVKPFLSLLGSLESAVVQTSRKCSKEQADLFKYSDGEIAILEDPTAAVLAKHGDRLAGFQEELALFLWWSYIFEEKIRRFNQLQASQKQASIDAKKQAEKQADVEAIEREQVPQKKPNGKGTVELRQR